MAAEPQEVALTPQVAGALTRYRVMAYAVGVMLLVLVAVAIPLRYAAGGGPPCA